MTSKWSHALFVLYEFLFYLEEEISVINDICIEIKLVHEVTSILHRLLTAFLLQCLFIKLNWSVRLISNQEEIYTCITLYWMSREYTLLSSRNSTRKSRFACTSRSYKYRSCKSNLINLRNLGTLRLSCSDILNTIQFNESRTGREGNSCQR